MDRAALFQLNPADKLQLIEDLWDNLAASPANVPVHDWQLAEYERRKSRFERDPSTTVSWEQAKQQILNHDGK